MLSRRHAHTVPAPAARRLKAALAAGALVALGTLAVPGHTAGNTLPSASTVGYGSVNVSGVTVKTVSYTLNADGTAITAAALVVHGNMSGKKVQAGFGSTASTTCTVGSYNSTSNDTPATCGGYSQTVSTAGTFNVTVVD